jgi:threonine/homoserine/homoserine lactone efflux protein
MEVLWIIFSFSFVVALSGAMAPGPLLTYTIIKTIQTERRGFLVGFLVIGGHALIESVLIVALLLGASAFLTSSLAAKIVGVVGGGFLVSLGINLCWNVLRGKVTDVFSQSGDRGEAVSRGGGIRNPVLGGALVSMSNPYWWIWWASIGFAFMLRYKISFLNWSALLAFLIGHEAGDLIWYALVSTLVFFGRRHINMRIYRIVLFVCGILMVGFGLYLGIGIIVV